MGEPLEAILADWARVATGFVVLGAQQVQVRRRELQRQLEPLVRDAIRRLAASSGPEAGKPAPGPEGQVTER